MYPIASNKTEAVSVCKKYFNLTKELQSNQYQALGELLNVKVVVIRRNK